MIEVEILHGRFNAERICKRVKDVEETFEGRDVYIGIIVDIPPGESPSEVKISISKPARKYLSGLRDAGGFKTYDSLMRDMCRVYTIHKFQESGIFYKWCEKKENK